MTKADVDLRHLRVFLCLFEYRSATRTAEALQTTQPAISIALAKLRKFYGDPLFVRTGQTMQPTSHAERLLKPITEALQLLDDSMHAAEVFEPETSNWHVRLALSDGGKLVVLPRLAHMLQREAPRISVEVFSIDGQTPDALEDGSVDLAFGYMTLRKQGLYQQKLFGEGFVCIVRDDHPAIGDSISREALLELGVVQVPGQGNSAPLLGKALERAHLQPRIAISVPTILGLAEVVGTTDYVAMLPEQAARELARYHPLKVVPLPFDMDRYEVSQHWHRRQHQDAGHRWLRARIVDLFRAQAGVQTNMLPPSTTSVWPDMKRAPSPTRNTSAPSRS